MRRDALRDPSAPIVVLALALLVTCWVLTALAGLTAPRWAAVYAALIIVGEVLRLRIPGSWHSLAPMSTASGLAYGLTAATTTPSVSLVPFAEVVAVIGFAELLGALVYAAGRRDAEPACLAYRLLATVVVVGLVHTLLRVEGVRSAMAHSPLWWLITVVLACAVSVALLLLTDALLGPRWQAPVSARVPDEFTMHGTIGAAAAATAAVMAIGATEIGLFAGPIFMLPLLLAVLAVRRSSTIRRTQAQTIRALSRATELGGYTEVGHADRVAQLCLRVGHELGLRQRRLQRLEVAALVHDIGQLSLSERIPAGATLLATPDQRRLIAERGAEVIQQTGAMADVAQIVRRQAVSFGEAADASGLAQDSQIVVVANAYDDLVGDEPSYQRQIQAMDRLRVDAGSQYDPVVVEALARALSMSAG